MSMLTLNETQDIVEDVMLKVHQAVVSTMGPNGKLALIENGTAVKVTKDGVTVAKSIKFDTAREELVNRIITEAAIKTDHECGDGTTTTVMLTGELYSLYSQYPDFREQKFIEFCVEAIVKELAAMAIKVTSDDERLFKLALTSSNSDYELSRIITDIYKGSGDRYPEIELKEGQSNEDKVVRSNGLPLTMGFSNPSFSVHGNGADTTLKNFVVIVLDETLGRDGPMLDLIGDLHEQFKQSKVEHVLIVARSIEHEVASTMLRMNNLVQNNRVMGRQVGVNEIEQGPLFVGVSTNAGGSVGSLIMQDIATIFDVPVFTTLHDALGANILASSCTVTVGNLRSLVTDMSGITLARLEARANSIEDELNSYEMGDRFSLRAKFNESRIRKLRGELVTVFVGGETYSEVKERLDRFEDVVKAVKSALVNGILPGVGSSLIIAGRRALMKIIEEAPIDRAQGATNEVLYEMFSDLFKSDAPYERKIIASLGQLIHAPYLHLMKQAPGVATTKVLWGGPEVAPVCVNLATGEQGTSEELGVYDTAFATITALKGGLQTAKILANARTILLGSKLTAVKAR